MLVGKKGREKLYAICLNCTVGSVFVVTRSITHRNGNEKAGKGGALNDGEFGGFFLQSFESPRGRSSSNSSRTELKTRATASEIGCSCCSLFGNEQKAREKSKC